MLNEYLDRLVEGLTHFCRIKGAQSLGADVVHFAEAEAECSYGHVIRGLESMVNQGHSVLCEALHPLQPSSKCEQRSPVKTRRDLVMHVSLRCISNFMSPVPRAALAPLTSKQPLAVRTMAAPLRKVCALFCRRPPRCCPLLFAKPR